MKYMHRLCLHQPLCTYNRREYHTVQNTTPVSISKYAGKGSKLPDAAVGEHSGTHPLLKPGSWSGGVPGLRIHSQHVWVAAEEVCESLASLWADLGQHVNSSLAQIQRLCLGRHKGGYTRLRLSHIGTHTTTQAHSHHRTLFLLIRISANSVLLGCRGGQ